ncbi:MAG: hypothetical protein EXS25_03525 [Pedosphaera sp.]|nr:hypothetical protein [Pedosphaera sp.]
MKNETEAELSGLLPLDLPRASVRLNLRRNRQVRPCERERAAWWFEQMRRVVAEGRDFPVAGV